MTAPKIKNPSQPISAKPDSDDVSEGAVSGKAVKRVAPYPIDINITKVEGQPPLHGHILKLTDVGFLMKVSTAHFYKVGENYPIYFELPVVGTGIHSTAKVIKTYDAIEATSKTQSTKMYTVEMHFKSLSYQDKTHINNFLVKSGQKKF
jgi:hypothetical protein